MTDLSGYTPDRSVDCARGALGTHLRHYDLRGHAGTRERALGADGKRERGKRLAALLTRKPKQARQQRMPGSRTRASHLRDYRPLALHCKGQTSGGWLAALLCVKKLKRTRQRTPAEAVRASQGGQTSKCCAAFGQPVSHCSYAESNAHGVGGWRRCCAMKSTHGSARRERRKPVPAVGEANQCSRVRPVVFHFAVLDGRKHSHKPAAARARD